VFIYVHLWLKMKIRTPIAEKKSRLEIIPLIDIMFFLLASFMMISLQMQIVRTLKASLPTATLATSTKKPDMVNLNVNKDGQVSVDDNNISFPALFILLTNRYSLNTNLPVYLTGADDATHGSVMFVLDFVKRAGIQNVAISVKAAPDSTP
jgi:biopolymer transport protein ExbD